MRTDCERCVSAGSVEFGICQVCLAEHPPETRFVEPIERFAFDPLPVEGLAESGAGVRILVGQTGR